MFEQPSRVRVGPDGHQVVDIVVDRGYHPRFIIARAGLPLRLIFRRDDQDACSERVVFSSPHFDRRLAPTGPTAVDIPPQPPGQIRFTCGMGRYRGRIDLLDERDPSLLGRLRNRMARAGIPLGTGLVLWIGVLPLIALLGVLDLDADALLAAAGVALVASVAGTFWAFRATCGRL